MDENIALVAGGYDTVYGTLTASPAFRRIWRAHGIGEDFPDGFDHISFLHLAEISRLRDELHLARGATLIDLACGAGGPGLWVARETGARLVGVDISAQGLDRARERAAATGMSENARFQLGSFDRTGLDAASADGAMTADALQYAPDKRAALAEIARILRPGARFAFVCFELAPARLTGVPILGADPVDDYRPLLDEGGFDVSVYEQTAGWEDRLTATYRAVMDARDALVPEMGEPAFNALSGEMSMTLTLRPYCGRVFAVATKR